MTVHLFAQRDPAFLKAMLILMLILYSARRKTVTVP